MATKRVIPDIEACIDCGGCEVACKRTWDVPHEGERIEVVTQNEGQSGTRYDQGETNVPMPCYHCADPPCVPVCPTDALEKQDNGLVQVDKDKCIGCTYCAWACPFGAPQFPDEADSTGSAGVMDKCTLCEPRLEEDKQPACFAECATDALIFGTPSEISDEFRARRGESLFDSEAAGIVFGRE